MALAAAGDDSLQHTDFQSGHGEQRKIPGPLLVSDLTSSHRPHKLEPLQPQQGKGAAAAVGGGTKTTKKKKTKRKRQGEVGEPRGDVDGREEASGDAEDPLLDASTLRQMQARLDPLYSAPINVEHQKISSGPESTPVRVEDEGERSRGIGEDEVSGERRRRKRGKSEEGEELEEMTRRREGEEEGGGGETGSRKRRRKRRTRRESGSESREREEQGPSASDEQQERPETPLATQTSHSPVPPLQTITPGTSRGASTAPHYFPPPEEIQDEEEEDGEGGGERVVEGAAPVPLSHHVSQSPGLVFVERADGRGFDVRRKSSGSVAPAASDDTLCLEYMDRPVSSELAALYSHQLVQKVSVTAHGLVAGLSLWGCVASNVIGSLSGRHLTLLQSYHLLSLPAHSLYLLLLSLVSLSLLDRLDLARVGRQCWQFSLRSLPGLAVLAAAVLTGVALILTLSLAATDDRVSLYPHQPSLWPDIVTPHNLTSTNSTLTAAFPTTHTLSQDDLTYLPTSADPTTPALGAWLGLSAFRSICCILGWGLLVLASSHDRMEEYISDMLKSSVKAQQEPWGPCGAPDPTSTSSQNQQQQNPPDTLQIEPTTAPTSTTRPRSPPA